jgi:hypothetical protein
MRPGGIGMLTAPISVLEQYQQLARENVSRPYASDGGICISLLQIIASRPAPVLARV